MKKGLNSFQLKCITVAMMIVGIYMQQVIYLLNEELIAGGGQLPQAQSLIYHMGYVIYLAAFPVAAFLLVVGLSVIVSMLISPLQRQLVKAVGGNVPDPGLFQRRRDRENISVDDE